MFECLSQPWCIQTTVLTTQHRVLSPGYQLAINNNIMKKIIIKPTYSKSIMESITKGFQDLSLDLKRKEEIIQQIRGIQARISYNFPTRLINIYK